MLKKFDGDKHSCLFVWNMSYKKKFLNIEWNLKWPAEKMLDNRVSSFLQPGVNFKTFFVCYLQMIILD